MSLDFHPVIVKVFIEITILDEVIDFRTKKEITERNSSTQKTCGAEILAPFQWGNKVEYH